MRLQKYLSAAGVCSRRQAEKWIEEGKISVNGIPAVIGMNVDETTDVICVNGERIINDSQYAYVILHKPKGVITSMNDEHGRKTVADIVKTSERLYPVGRLDYATEGLLLMTNDGELAQRMMHPSHEIQKTYHVWTSGADPNLAVNRLSNSLEYSGVIYKKPDDVHIVSKGSVSVLSITVSEGKNHEIRNMCAASGLKVHRLVRVSQGPLELGTLSSGQWRYLTDEEVVKLKRLKEDSL